MKMCILPKISPAAGWFLPFTAILVLNGSTEHSVIGRVQIRWDIDRMSIFDKFPESNEAVTLEPWNLDGEVLWLKKYDSHCQIWLNVTNLRLTSTFIDWLWEGVKHHMIIFGSHFNLNYIKKDSKIIIVYECSLTGSY